MKALPIICIFLIFYSVNATAYIDPGTSGMIIGGSIWPYILMGLSAIGAFLLKYFYRPIKSIFKKRK